jgi:hypothetical protein
MATMKVRGSELRVRFAAWERPIVWRAGLDVPLTAIRSVERVEDALGRTRGGRVAFLISGVVKVGRWGLGTGTRQLVSVRRKAPTLRITLDRTVTGYDELLISTKDADRLAEVIRR